MTGPGEHADQECRDKVEDMLDALKEDGSEIRGFTVAFLLADGRVATQSFGPGVPLAGAAELLKLECLGINPKDKRPMREAPAPAFHHGSLN